MKTKALILAMLLASLVTGSSCAPKSSGGGGAGTTGSAAGTTGNQTGAAGTTGNPTGAAGTTGNPTGAAGTTGNPTGAAGTTGNPTGAAGVTGAGGAAGTAVIVQKVCATKVTLMNPTLVDFETYTGTVTADMFGAPFGGATPGTTQAAPADAYVGPFAYPENTGTTQPTLALLAGHPPSSMWAVSSTLAATAWGMGGGMWMSKCANASAYKGISFWVRGSGPLTVFEFSLAMESTQLPSGTNNAGGGTCTGTDTTCKPAVKSNIPLTADWTQVSILWADFTPGMSGTTTVVPNGDNISGLGWSVPLQFTLDPQSMDAAGPYIPVPATITLNIDDIAFIP